MARLDSKEIVRAAARAAHNLDQLLPLAMAKVADAVVNRARETTLFNDRTGRLRSTIRSGPITGSFSEGDLAVDFYAGGLGGVKYAIPVHNGSRPHVIEAGRSTRNRRRPALRFVVGGGSFMFRRRVMHPGTKPRPFITEAIEASVAVAERDITAATRLAFVRAGFDIGGGP